MSPKIILFFSYIFSSPTKALVSTWILWTILVVFSPFYYTTPPSPFIILFILGCILCFAIGELFTNLALKPSRKKKFKKEDENKVVNLESKISSKYMRRLDRFVFILSITGLVGSTLFIISKVLFSGLDFTLGITGARIQQVSDVLAGNVNSTPFMTYIGLLTFPCATTAFLTSFLQPNLTPKTLKWSRFSVIAPVAVTIVTGGRGGIIQILVMFLSTTLINHYCKKSLNNIKSADKKNWDRAKIGKIFLIFVILFAIYNIYIFNSRRELTNATNFQFSLAHWEQDYGIYPAAFLKDLVELRIVGSDSLLNIMQTFYYLTSGPSVLTMLVNSRSNIDLSLGLYQVSMLGSLINKFFPDNNSFARLMSDLSQAGVGGLLPSAWGMMLVDFGFMGTFFEAFLLGCISKVVYYFAIHRGKLGDKLMFLFTVMSIVMSPIVAPLGFSDSFFTIIVFWVTGKLLNHFSSKPHTILT
jgi:oligosaccharide repeat unit polymerase